MTSAREQTFEDFKVQAHLSSPHSPPPDLQEPEGRIETPPCGSVLYAMKALVPFPHVMRDHPSASKLSGQHGVRDIGGIWKGERDEVGPCGRQVEGVAPGQEGGPRWRAVTIGLSGKNGVGVG